MRSTIGEIVEFCYGGDGLDPVHMESKLQPVEPQRQFTHIQAVYPDKSGRALKSDEIIPTLNKILDEENLKPVKSNYPCNKLM